MRCPHCAAKAVEGPVCRVCGSTLDMPPRQETLADLVLTREPATQVPVQPIPDLIVNEETFGSDGDVEDMPHDEARRCCSRCGADAGEARFCERCGHAIQRVGAARPLELVPVLRCMECGVPNPRERRQCLSCGATL